MVRPRIIKGSLTYGKRYIGETTSPVDIRKTQMTYQTPYKRGKEGMCPTPTNENSRRDKGRGIISTLGGIRKILHRKVRYKKYQNKSDIRILLPRDFQSLFQHHSYQRPPTTLFFGFCFLCLIHLIIDTRER